MYCGIYFYFTISLELLFIFFVGECIANIRKFRMYTVWLYFILVILVGKSVSLIIGLLVRRYCVFRRWSRCFFQRGRSWRCSRCRGSYHRLILWSRRNRFLYRLCFNRVNRFFRLVIIGNRSCYFNYRLFMRQLILLSSILSSIFGGFFSLWILTFISCLGSSASSFDFITSRFFSLFPST